MYIGIVYSYLPFMILRCSQRSAKQDRACWRPPPISAPRRGRPLAGDVPLSCRASAQAHCSASSRSSASYRDPDCSRAPTLDDRANAVAEFFTNKTGRSPLGRHRAAGPPRRAALLYERGGAPPAGGALMASRKINRLSRSTSAASRWAGVPLPAIVILVIFPQRLAAGDGVGAAGRCAGNSSSSTTARCWMLAWMSLRVGAVSATDRDRPRTLGAVARPR